MVAGEETEGDPPVKLAALQWIFTDFTYTTSQKLGQHLLIQCLFFIIFNNAQY